MSHVHTTWYRLVDGTQADPTDVTRDADGVLRHKNGVAVAMRDSGVPRSTGARDNPAVNAPAAPSRDLTAAADKPASDDREMKPAASSGKGYRTRGPKA